MSLVEILDFFKDMDPLVNMTYTIFIIVISVCSFFRIKYHSSINKFLKILFGKDSLKSLHYYVNTRGQNIDPCENDEIKRTNEYNISQKLIPLFINNYFKNGIPYQYYAVLADSGMGKTTFMIKLFKKYGQKHFRKYKIELIPLLFFDVLQRIERIEDKQNTILLLDGLDENPDAMENYEEFLEELLNSTETFYKVIITCRTQFFPNEKSEPYETGKINLSINNKKKTFYKIYLSPFNDKDITYFLKRRYPLFLKNKRKKAMKIIKKCPYLMVRPMLLSYIDDLIDSEDNYDYVYQIYEQLVAKWINRENLSADTLYDFTKQTALEMYGNNSIYITTKDISELCNKYDITLKDIEARSKSLLNRNGLGQYKFAHKSIYEYILAKEALENMEFRKIHDFTNLDMARFFVNEMIEEICRAIGESKNININFSRLGAMDLNLNNKNFIITEFYSAIFRNCSFSNSEIQNAVFNQCRFINCDLTGINLQGLHGIEVEFIDCVLEYASFENAFLDGCIITNCSLRDCNFSYSRIINSFFTKSDIAYSDLTNIYLHASKFDKMILAPIIYDNVQMDQELINDIVMANKLSETLILNE